MRFMLNANLETDGIDDSGVLIGEVFHIATNIRTPVGRYFAWHPMFIEDFNGHWRVDCFVRKHLLSPSPDVLGTALVAGLINKGLCCEPLWLSVYKSEEVAGIQYEEVFED